MEWPPSEEVGAPSLEVFKERIGQPFAQSGVRIPALVRGWTGRPPRSCSTLWLYIQTEHHLVNDWMGGFTFVIRKAGYRCNKRIMSMYGKSTTGEQTSFYGTCTSFTWICYALLAAADCIELVLWDSMAFPVTWIFYLWHMQIISCMVSTDLSQGASIYVSQPDHNVYLKRDYVHKHQGSQ